MNLKLKLKLYLFNKKINGFRLDNSKQKSN